MSKALKNKVKLNDIVSVTDYGAVGDGVTDDTAAIQAAFTYAASIRPASAEIVVNFGTGNVYLISSTILVDDVSISGNGATLLSNTAITMMQINGNNQVYSDFNLWFGSEQSSATAIALKLTDGVLQASKNTYINITTRNAYDGLYNSGGSASAGSIWGSVFINCRANYSYNYGWYINGATGATTCTFINCHATGSSSGSQAKGFYINNIAEVVCTNCAADGMKDGQALVINTAFSAIVDSFALESCTITSASGYHVSVGANAVADIRSISATACTYNVGGGNKAYILRVASGTDVRVGSINESGATVTSGTVYKMRTSSSARTLSENVPLSSVDTLGNYELFFDFGRFKGLASSDPGVSWTKTYEVGDIAINRLPASAGYIGWVCTVAGTPGTWKTFGLIS